MMKVNENWNGDTAYASVVAAGWEGIRRATVFYLNAIQNALNKPNSGMDVPTPGGGSRRVYPNSSKPGEPPRKITGFGAGNVLADYDQAALKSRVGVAQGARYMVAMELGVSSPVTIRARAKKALMWYSFGARKWMFAKSVTLPPRPKRAFLLPTLQKHWSQIQAMAGSGADSGSGG